MSVPRWSPADLLTLARAHGMPAESSVGLVLQAPDGTITTFTAPACLILGMSVDQLHGRTSQDPRWAAVDADGELLPPAEHPAMRALGSGVRVSAVLGVHRPTTDEVGDYVWLDVVSQPILAAPGAGPVAVLSALTVVTGDRLVELRRGVADRMFRLLAQHSSDVIALHSPDGTYLWVSPSAARVLGRTPASLVGTSVADLVHPDDVATLRGEFGLGYDGPSLYRVRHGYGGWIWIETTMTVIRGEDGVPQRLQTTSRDVTARQELELDRDRAVELFTTSFSKAPLGMALRALDGRLTQVNPALCALLGRPPAELVGSSLGQYADVIGAARAQRGMDELSGAAVQIDEVELHFVRPDASVVWGHASTVLIRDPDGSPRCFLTQIHDVTTRRIETLLLQQHAETDPLTGLPNRRVLMTRLDTALVAAEGAGSPVALLFIDLDRFKEVNDQLGHDAGDALLRAAAGRLLSIVRETDTVSRLGGDEFAVLCGGLRDEVVGQEVAARIVGALAEPFLVAGRQLDIGASVGVAYGQGGSAADLLRRADRSMYAAKVAGGSRVHVEGRVASATHPGAAPPQYT